MLEKHLQASPNSKIDMYKSIHLYYMYIKKVFTK